MSAMADTGSQASASPIRVLVADDHPVVRHGLKQILGEDPEIVVAGEASTAPEVQQRLRGGAYDVLLLDLSMPGGHGLDVLEAVRREWPALKPTTCAPAPGRRFPSGPGLPPAG